MMVKGVQLISPLRARLGNIQICDGFNRVVPLG